MTLAFAGVDILPLVYRNSSFNIFVVQLTDSLDTKPRVCLYEKAQNVYTLGYKIMHGIFIHT